MWLVCEDKNIISAKDKLTSLFNEYRLYSSDIDPIKTIEDLAKHIEFCVDGGYPMLNPVDEVSYFRKDYMKSNVGALVQSVVNKNTDAFGFSSMSNQ